MKNFIMEIIKNYKNYESCTGRDELGMRLKHDLSCSEIPVGLLRDITAERDALTEQQRNYAWNAFSAYCMNLCAKKYCRNEDREIVEEIVSHDFIMEAAACAQKSSANGSFKGFHALFSNLAEWRYKDARRKNCVRKIDRKNSTGGKKRYLWVPRVMIPMEEVYENDDSTMINKELLAYITETSIAEADKKENVELVRETIQACRDLGLLTPEHIEILSSKYGIGEDGEMLKQNRIAEKLGVSNSYVSRKLAEACAIMHRYITDNCRAA